MIDNATILFTTLMTVYVLYRAVRLDRALPWFETRSMYEKRIAKSGPVAPTGGLPSSGRQMTAGRVSPATRRDWTSS